MYGQLCVCSCAAAASQKTAGDGTLAKNAAVQLFLQVDARGWLMHENDCENGAQCKGAPRGMRRARLKPDYMDRPRPGTKRK